MSESKKVEDLRDKFSKAVLDGSAIPLSNILEAFKDYDGPEISGMLPDLPDEKMK